MWTMNKRRFITCSLFVPTTLHVHHYESSRKRLKTSLTLRACFRCCYSNIIMWLTLFIISMYTSVFNDDWIKALRFWQHKISDTPSRRRWNLFLTSSKGWSGPSVDGTVWLKKWRKHFYMTNCRMAFIMIRCRSHLCTRSCVWPHGIKRRDNWRCREGRSIAMQGLEVGPQDKLNIVKYETWLLWSLKCFNRTSSSSMELVPQVGMKCFLLVHPSHPKSQDCFACGKAGHIARDCRSPKSESKGIKRDNATMGQVTSQEKKQPTPSDYLYFSSLDEGVKQVCLQDQWCKPWCA